MTKQMLSVIMVVLATTSAVQADIVTLNGHRADLGNSANYWVTDSKSETHVASPFLLNDRKDQFWGFSSMGLNECWQGMATEFTVTSLADSTMFSNLQATRFAELLSHTYSSAVNSGGLNAEIAGAVQGAIWEIAYETQNFGSLHGAFGNDAGDIYWTYGSDSAGSPPYYTSNQFLDALKTDTFDELSFWGPNGLLDFTAHADYDFYVYTAVDRLSSSYESPEWFIRVVEKGGIAATPEPASIVIFGIGLACSGVFLNRRRRKNTCKNNAESLHRRAKLLKL